MQRNERRDPVADGRASFGSPAECRHFAARNRDFVQAWPTLSRAMNYAFDGATPARSLADAVVFAVAARAANDFKDLSILACNGRGLGALDMLRGMFERTVTAMYLGLEPGKAGAYAKFHGLAAQKLLDQSEQNAELVQAVLSSRLSEVEADVDDVDGYHVPDCTRCLSRGRGETWTELDTVAMAERVGLRDVLLQCCCVPKRHMHALVDNMLHGLAANSRRSRSGVSAERDCADQAVSGGHHLSLVLLHLLIRQFGLEETPDVLQAFADYERLSETSLRTAVGL